MTLFGRRKVPEQFIISDGDDADFFRGVLEGFFSEDSLTMRDYFIRQKSATLSEETRQHQGTYQSGDEAGVAGRYQQAPSFQQKKISIFLREMLGCLIFPEEVDIPISLQGRAHLPSPGISKNMFFLAEAWQRNYRVALTGWTGPEGKS